MSDELNAQSIISSFFPVKFRKAAALICILIIGLGAVFQDDFRNFTYKNILGHVQSSPIPSIYMKSADCFTSDDRPLRTGGLVYSGGVVDIQASVSEEAFLVIFGLDNQGIFEIFPGKSLASRRGEIASVKVRSQSLLHEEFVVAALDERVLSEEQVIFAVTSFDEFLLDKKQLIDSIRIGSAKGIDKIYLLELGRGYNVKSKYFTVQSNHKCDG